MEKKLAKHTLNLYEGDLAELAEIHPYIAPSIIVRSLVRKHIEKVRGQVATGVPAPTISTEELPNE